MKILPKNNNNVIVEKEEKEASVDRGGDRGGRCRPSGVVQKQKRFEKQVRLRGEGGKKIGADP